MIDISADAKSVRLDIYVEDGRKFKAALNVYSELNINMDMVFSEVEKHYMTPSITDKEKAEKAAWYISTVSDKQFNHLFFYCNIKYSVTNTMTRASSFSLLYLNVSRRVR